MCQQAGFLSVVKHLPLVLSLAALLPSLAAAQALDGDATLPTVNVIGTSPVELLRADRKAQFTAPNEVANRYVAAGLTGNFDLTDRLSIQALAHYRHFQQDVANGNVANDAPCKDGSGLLCSDAGVVSTTTGGIPIRNFLAGARIRSSTCRRPSPTPMAHRCRSRAPGTCSGCAITSSPA